MVWSKLPSPTQTSNSGSKVGEGVGSAVGDPVGTLVEGFGDGEVGCAEGCIVGAHVGGMLPFPSIRLRPSRSCHRSSRRRGVDIEVLKFVK